MKDYQFIAINPIKFKPISLRSLISFSILIIFVISLTPTVSSQTTEHLTQLNNSSSFLSPSETGRSNNFRVLVHYRNQWKSIATPYTINVASLDLPLLKGKIGVGGYFFQESLGDNIHKSFSGKLSAAYHLKSKLATKDIISFGIETGILQNSNNGTSSLWEEQWNGFKFDESIAASDQNIYGKSSKSAFDMGAGITWGATYLNKFKTKIGASIKHLNKPVYNSLNSENKIHRRFTIYGALEIRKQRSSSVITSEKPFLSPDFIYSSQGKFKVIQFGSFISFPIKVKSKYTKNGSNVNFKLGTHLRVKDAIILNTAFRYNNFYIGLSYDYTISKLKSAGLTSSFELLLKYKVNLFK